jgi:Flp pilus assembly pilin Flp
MLNKLIKDESGLSTIEILVGMIVLVLLAIISFAALRTGIKTGADSLGNKASGMVDKSQGAATTNQTGETAAPSHNLAW